MANAKRQVLIVHGWSDSYESFQPLKNVLVSAGYQTRRCSWARMPPCGTT
jgi:hypothetical protein